jgi:hypothetical protein
MGLDEKEKENDDGVCFDVGYWDPRSQDAIFAFPLSLSEHLLSRRGQKNGLLICHIPMVLEIESLLFVSQKFQSVFFFRRCVVLIFCAAKNS